LHHSAWDTKLKELLSTLPVERLSIEQGLHKIFEVIPVDVPNIDLLNGECDDVSDIERNCGASDSHIEMDDKKVTPANVHNSRDTLRRRRDERFMDCLQEALGAVELHEAEPTWDGPHAVVASIK